jgi:hypothetical protein
LNAHGSSNKVVANLHHSRVRAVAIRLIRPRRKLSIDSSSELLKITVTSRCTTL